MTMSNVMKPSLRLSPYKDDWEKFVLKDKASFSTGHGYSKNDLRTVGKPIILYGRLYTNYETIIRDVDTFVIEQPNSILSKGGEIIIPSSGETAEDISVASMIAKAGIIIGGGLNIIRTDEIEPAFLALLLTFGKPHQDLAKSAQGKTIVHLYNQDISQVDIVIPKTKEEQRTLAYFVDKMDSMIIRTEKELSKLQEVKKAYRSMLFPRPGEKQPRLRFKGFTEDWTKKNLGECFTERPERSTNGELLSVTQSSGIKRFSEIGRHDNSNIASGNYKVVKCGDIAYNSMRMWQGANGWSPYDGIVSPAYTVIVPKENVSSLFFSFLFKKPEIIHLFRINSQGLTSDTWNLKFPAFSKIEVYCPNSFEEQNEIANFLMSIDTLISTYSRRIEKFRHIKSACLDGMFVNE